MKRRSLFDHINMVGGHNSSEVYKVIGFLQDIFVIQHENGGFHKYPKIKTKTFHSICFNKKKWYWWGKHNGAKYRHMFNSLEYLIFAPGLLIDMVKNLEFNSTNSCCAKLSWTIRENYMNLEQYGTNPDHLDLTWWHIISHQVKPFGLSLPSTLDLILPSTLEKDCMVDLGRIIWITIQTIWGPPC